MFCLSLLKMSKQFLITVYTKCTNNGILMSIAQLWQIKLLLFWSKQLTESMSQFITNLKGTSFTDVIE